MTLAVEIAAQRIVMEGLVRMFASANPIALDQLKRFCVLRGSEEGVMVVSDIGNVTIEDAAKEASRFVDSIIEAKRQASGPPN